MFMPQSQPFHGRSHGAPSTVRRRGDKENAGALPSKTPSRNALKQVGGPSTGRMLGKTMTIDRNVLAPKSDAPAPTDDIKPKRLFANTQPPPSTTRPVKQRSVKTPGHAKTPAPYRDLEPEPQPTPLPSAQRMRRRSRNSLVRTPEHQWEQDISLGSIAEVELEPETPPVESDYELEYAPSPVKDVPYVPEWADSIPDPIETMAKLGSMRPMLYVPAPSPPPALQPVPMPTLELCSDNEIEEPALRRPKPAPAVAKPENVPASKPTSRSLGIRGPAGTARSTTSTARPLNRPNTTARPATTRPAPTAGATRPVAAKTTLARSGAAPKPATVTRPGPLGAARTTAAPRTATAARPATTSTKPGIRGVPSKTENRPPASRPVAVSAVRKLAPTTQPGRLASRPAVKPSTTRPALGPKTTAAPRAAASPVAASPVAAPTPSSPPPEFADMDMDFGALDLNFDELEPKVQLPAVDLGSDESFTDSPVPKVESEVLTGPAVAASPSTYPTEASAPLPSTDAIEALAQPPAPAQAAVDIELDEDDFEAVDPALAPPVLTPTPSVLAFEPIPEETELDVSEDMSLESI